MNKSSDTLQEGVVGTGMYQQLMTTRSPEFHGHGLLKLIKIIILVEEKNK